MEIRKITIEELDKLMVLFKHRDFEKYKNDLKQDIINKVRDIYIVVNENKFIGELTVYYKSSELETIPNIRVYLSAYRVLKDYQGKGIGKKLLEYVINDLEKQGYTEFTVGVEDDNSVAIHIYEQFGFNEVIARLSDEYDGKLFEYNLLLRKNINKK